MTPPLVALLLCVLPVGAEDPQPGVPLADAAPDIERPEPWLADPGALPDELVAAVHASRELPIGARMGAISDPLVGRPYQDGCTGEGQGYDDDPPARYDVFDCVTFLEEVLALSLAADPAWAGHYRTQLRFGDSQPSYESRNHFFVMEWIAHNVEAGFIQDITASLGPVTLIDKQVTPETWASWRRRSWFPLGDERLPTGSLYLPVLPLETALEVVKDIPDGAIIVTVRIPLEHVPIVVTHVGFTVPAELPTMRHATRMGEGGVRDDSLAWYVEHLQSYTNWPVAGVNVLMPLEQGPRLGALPDGTQGMP